MSLPLEAIFDDIANGKSLRQSCEDRGVHKTQVRRAIEADEAVRVQYARAREEQAHFYADEIIEIADKTDLHPDDKRVRNDARKWFASKVAPKVYGDKVTTEHTGQIGVTISKIENVIVDPVNETANGAQQNELAPASRAQ